MEKFITEAIKLYGTKYDYSKVVYINRSEKITIKCIKHNSIFEQRLSRHLTHEGCKQCAIEKTNETKKENSKNTIILNSFEDFDNDNTAICPSCKNMYYIINFLSLETIEITLCSLCISCRLDYNTQSYTKHFKCRIIFNIFKQKGCIDCGSFECIEADHVTDDKVEKLSNFSYWSSRLNEFKFELTKCEPRCKMCHNIKSLKINSSRKLEEDLINKSAKIHRTAAIEYKNSLKVGKICAYDNCTKLCIKGIESSFDWDHLDRTTKIAPIASMRNFKKIDEEIVKCRLLCSNHHVIWSKIQQKEFSNSRYNFIINHKKYKIAEPSKIRVVIDLTAEELLKLKKDEENDEIKHKVRICRRIEDDLSTPEGIKEANIRLRSRISVNKSNANKKLREKEIEENEDD